MFASETYIEFRVINTGMTKLCSTCKVQKSLAEFSTLSSAKDGLSYTCKSCHRSRSTNWYTRNKPRVLDRTRAGRLDIVRKLREYKEQHGCPFCSETYHRCLHFHHLEPEHKDFNVSEGTNCGSWSKILHEISKCIVVCGNCHVKLHDGLLTHTRCQ